jgi:hypothetical protein
MSRCQVINTANRNITTASLGFSQHFQGPGATANDVRTLGRGLSPIVQLRIISAKFQDANGSGGREDSVVLC